MGVVVAVALAVLAIVLGMRLRQLWWREGAASRAPAERHPFRCVAVAVRGNGCAAARELARRRFLAGEAPRLPLQGCSNPSCACVYEHFEDRRHHDRRSAFAGDPDLATERRSSRGRRHTDVDYATH